MKHFTLLSLVVATLLFTACGEKTKEAAGDAANKVTEAVKADTASAVEATKKSATEVTESAKTKVAKVVEAVKAKADSMTESAAKKVAEVKTTAEAQVSNAVEAAKEKVAAVTQPAAVAPAAYAKCKGCHGAEGQNKALGKSAILAGQDKAALVAAIKGYKAGTRNVAGMGALMKGQVAAMSDADIEAVAAYLSQK